MQVPTQIVGSTYYRGASKALTVMTSGERLLLKREPDNKFDKNAVSVWTSEEQQLGHISRAVAVVVAPQLDSGAIDTEASFLTPNMVVLKAPGDG